VTVAVDATKPVVDPSILSVLQEMDDEEGRPGEFVAEVALNSASTLDDLRRAVASEDRPRIRSSAHNLQGSVGLLGARRMAHLCAQMQRLARGYDLTAMPQLMRLIEQEFDQVCLTIREASPSPYNDAASEL
jgi:HPt (histidine-containing phosphotransfer) domain-containing protein